MISMKPFLKWVGGKTQIIDQVLSMFPNEMNNYHEPFLGGGSVLLGVLSSPDIKIQGKIYASDINPKLIALYKNIQSAQEDVITELNKLVNDFSKAKGTEVNRDPSCIDEALTSQESYYYWVRKTFNSQTNDTPMSAAMLLFLNKTCFRGVYREGPRGFNVPFGNYKNPSIFEPEYIRSVSVLIKDVIFVTQSFESSLEKVSSGDFVYMDPPYAPENDTSFVKYTKDGFGKGNHELLFRLAREKCGAFVLSNSDVKLVRDSFPEPLYSTQVISCRRSINSKNPEARTNEVLVSRGR